MRMTARIPLRRRALPVLVVCFVLIQGLAVAATAVCTTGQVADLVRNVARP